jgi:hypothetical protein
MEMWRALIRSPLGRGLGNATDPIQKKKKKKEKKEENKKSLTKKNKIKKWRGLRRVICWA